MVSLIFVFWLFVVMFALIGAMRGWAKELLVTFSVILALFVITIMQGYVPQIWKSLQGVSARAQFWTRTIIVVVLVFFGYQTPRLPSLPSKKFARDTLQDLLLGFVLGGLNGILIVGTIWFYLHDANYPFPFIVPPQPGDTVMGGDMAIKMISYLPPHWLGVPGVFFAVGIAFVFVLIVFV